MNHYRGMFNNDIGITPVHKIGGDNVELRSAFYKNFNIHEEVISCANIEGVTIKTLDAYCISHMLIALPDKYLPGALTILRTLINADAGVGVGVDINVDADISVDITYPKFLKAYLKHLKEAGDVKLEIVYDTETTGLPELDSYGPEYYDNFNKARLLSISYIILLDRRIICYDYHVVRPDFHPESVNWASAEAVHKLSYAHVSEVGESVRDVLEVFALFIESGLISQVIGHNIRFDIGIMAAELHRYGYDNAGRLLVRLPKYCTMLMGVNCYGWKRGMRLSELSNKLFGRLPKYGDKDYLHSASYDTYVTYVCFYRLTQIHVDRMNPDNFQMDDTKSEMLCGKTFGDIFMTADVDDIVKYISGHCDVQRAKLGGCTEDNGAFRKYTFRNWSKRVAEGNAFMRVYHREFYGYLHDKIRAVLEAEPINPNQYARALLIIDKCPDKYCFPYLLKHIPAGIDTEYTEDMCLNGSADLPLYVTHNKIHQKYIILLSDIKTKGITKDITNALNLMTV